MKLRILATLVVCLAASGCRTASTGNVPPPSPYDIAGGYMLQFSQKALDAQAIEQNLYAGGVIDKPTHLIIAQAFKDLSLAGPQITALIRAQASSLTIIDKVKAAAAQLGTITSASSTLDQATKDRIAASVGAVQLLLNGVAIALSSNLATSEAPLDRSSDHRLSRIYRAAHPARHPRLQIA